MSGVPAAGERGVSNGQFRFFSFFFSCTEGNVDELHVDKGDVAEVRQQDALVATCCFIGMHSPS